jgi:hypothetical protein
MVDAIAVLHRVEHRELLRRRAPDQPLGASRELPEPARRRTDGTREADEAQRARPAPHEVELREVHAALGAQGQPLGELTQDLRGPLRRLERFDLLEQTRRDVLGFLAQDRLQPLEGRGLIEAGRLGQHGREATLHGGHASNAA